MSNFSTKLASKQTGMKIKTVFHCMFRTSRYSIKEPRKGVIGLIEKANNYFSKNIQTLSCIILRIFSLFSNRMLF